MGYPPNTTIWQRGDIVIHAADEKAEHMLMEIVGYSRDGFCQAKYIHPGYFDTMPKRTLKFRSVDLLNPVDFGLETG